jgi:hypothetical protein
VDLLCMLNRQPLHCAGAGWFPVSVNHAPQSRQAENFLMKRPRLERQLVDSSVL